MSRAIDGIADFHLGGLGSVAEFGGALDDRFNPTGAEAGVGAGALGDVAVGPDGEGVGTRRQGRTDDRQDVGLNQRSGAGLMKVRAVRAAGAWVGEFDVYAESRVGPRHHAWRRRRGQLCGVGEGRRVGRPVG